ncbi:LacI family transcriptional regulator [Dyadobacter jejuensis]|uniref:LacI family transcriptional regulator n=1 Tax=Dyadobacter jejuensis TaxID=1082580 RepID=A0A316A8R2_9BACT|nr:LacI family DNA-binding transcriptional regulator [Dyadobacter jejuensis]PWJ53370.1 LacI family transcriptional regulator [Dyadobacter jejuensis]
MMGKDDKVYLGVKEIAKRAKVSIATVDRVLHNRTGVSEKTRKKINDIIAEIDYRPNILASRLASRKAIQMAVLVPHTSIDTSFWEAPLQGIQRAAKELESYGIRLVYYFFDLNDRHSFTAQASKLLTTELDGLLMSPTFVDESIALTSRCDELKIPYVFIDADLSTSQKISYIGPHLFQSGYVGAKLLTYRAVSPFTVLVVNISKEIENNNHLTIEAGFRSYFKEKELQNRLVTIDIRDTDNLSVARHLTEALHNHPHVEGVFVTNSRVSSVATFLTKLNRPEIRLIGYDFLQENCQFLDQGVIDFLICHKPEEQGYRGVMTLYQYLVVDTTVEKMQYMPIDIVTMENRSFYQN